MQRVTRSTAAAVLPAAPASPGTPGYFTGGDPVGAVPATVPGYEWFNGVQEELVGAIARAGLTPDHADLAQLRKGMDRLYGGGLRSVAANTTLTADDAGVVLVDASGAARTITLPAAAAANARPVRIRVVKTDSSANAVTVQRAGSDTIEGATSIALTSQWSAAALMSDGVNAWVHQIGLAATNTTRGTVRLSQNAETDAGSSALIAVTPASLQIATRSLAANGYQRLPGGLILQWGAVARASRTLSAAAVVTFPLAFPTACYAVIPTIDYDNAGLLDMWAAADAPTLTQVTLLAGQSLFAEGTDSRTFGWRWIAVGT